MGRIWLILVAVSLVLASAGCTFIPVPPLPPTSVTPPQGAVAADTPTPSPPLTARRTTTATSPPTPRPSVTPQPDELVRYVVDLINKDRSDYGLPPVVAGSNSAAQRHADDMFNEFYLAHWDTDGMKPYMRYTLAGGANYEAENSAYSGWYDKTEDPNHYAPLDAKQELKELEYRMMYDDAESNWGHRDNILNPRHQKVNVGIAHDGHRLTLVQQFEGDYIVLPAAPHLADGILTIAGQVSLGTADSVAVFYDPLPGPMTQADLRATPHSYSLGTRIVSILPPPPPGYTYSRLPPDAIVAELWEAGPSGFFRVLTGIGPFLAQYGPGVYTVVIWTKTGDQYVALTNYSLFLR